MKVRIWFFGLEPYTEVEMAKRVEMMSQVSSHTKVSAERTLSGSWLKQQLGRLNFSSFVSSQVHRWKIRILVVMILLPLSALCASDSVQFPDGFRRWIQVEIGAILPGTDPKLTSEEGMHHIFANQKATDAYTSGDFPDGSIIVYELREAQETAGDVIEGDRKRVDVMIKDSTLYQGTGGWRFERFWGADEVQNVVHDSGTSCFQCHSKANTHGFVFSRLH